jgi:hypothetical protein
MKKKPTTFIFSIRLPEFSTLMKEKLTYVRRDITEFNKFGVTKDTVDETDGILLDFENIPNDEELEGAQVLTTQTKDTQAETLRVAITLIMNRAESKYGKESGMYRKFGVDAVSKLDGGKLTYVSKRVLRVATSLLTDLASKGLTQAILTELELLISNYEKALSAQEDAMSDRDIATEDRAVKANEVYKIVTDLCVTGKRIWASRNEAKYNDYLIYDTPSGGPEATPKASGDTTTPTK